MVYKIKIICYNKLMSKDYKRCPRCNYKTPTQFCRCGNCGLNYDKFSSATNAEAKSAFRMGEKERVLHTKQRPSDVSKIGILLKCIFGGWFGLHYFSLGKIWRGVFHIVGFAMAFVYAYCAMKFNIRTGYLGYFVLLCGFIWVASFIIWLVDIFSIIFNKFKYPVSLPYSNQETK